MGESIHEAVFKVEPKKIRPIPGFPGYSAREDGVIYSDNYRRTGRRHPLSQWAQIDGYKRVKIKGTAPFVHRLIAFAFIPNPENKPQINHLNGQKGDNQAKNLEWCTQHENMAHAVQTGLKVNRSINVGENSPVAKLNDDLVREIRLSKEKTVAMSRRLGVCRHTIQKVRARKSWRHIK